MVKNLPGESNPLLPHAHRVALALAGEEGNLREAELVVLAHQLVHLMAVLHAPRTTHAREGLVAERGKGGNASVGKVGELDAHLSFLLELSHQVARQGAALLRGQGDTVAGHLELGAGEQALARARNITNHLVVAVTAEATELVLQQVGALHLDPLSIKEHIDLG